MLPPEEAKPNQGNFDLTEAEISNFHFTPYEHQIEAINYGLHPDHKQWLLLDSMGLGKTLEIIGLAEALHMRGLIDHCMIICGVDSLRQNWKSEIKKFSNLSVQILGEYFTKTGRFRYKTVKERIELLKKPISEFFIIINATTLRDDDIVKAIKKGPNKFGMIAVDEAHRFTTDSKQGDHLLDLDAEYKVAATGTLLVNSPISCYLPLKWTGNDHAILSNFKGQYCVFGGFGDKQVVDYKNLTALQEEINTCSIRRTLEQVRDDMPQKNINYEVVEMSDQHRKFYDAIVDGVKEEADLVKLNTSNLLALTTRLRQASACPSILTSQPIVSSKLERAVEIATDLLDAGEKVVIFSVFKEPVYQLAKMLEAYQPLVGTGDVSEQTIKANIEAFQNDPNSKLFIGSHAKMGTGFTLNSASYMICIDTPYTDAAFSQSTDRIWRITNTRPAFVTVLTCADTIDERVREIVETKKDLADFVVDGKENSISDGLARELRNIILNL